MLRYSILALFFSFAAFGTTMTVDPPNPDSKTSISVWFNGIWTVSCTPRDPKVTVVGNDVNVVFNTGYTCGQLLTPWSNSARIGTLPAGTYRLHATAVPTDGTLTGPPEPVGEFTLTVSQADAPFTITPNAASTSAQTFVIIESPNVPLQGPVLFGDVPSTNVTQINTHQLRVLVPQHAPGVVTVTANGFPAVNSFRFFDPSAAPDDAVFETILVPMLYDGPGAFGSRWTTDLFLRNENTLPVTSYRPLYYTGCSFIFGFCPDTIEAGKTVKILPNPELPPNGLIFRPLRQQSSAIFFSARVRDTSREADDLGAEMPIVREAELRRGRVVLADVIVDPRYRTTLRIYGVDEIPKSLSIIVNGVAIQYPASELPKRLPGDVPWTTTIDGSFIAATPTANGHYAVEVKAEPAGGRIWALASITNNNSQHVTLVKPQ